jgi:hypothetical protein
MAQPIIFKLQQPFELRGFAPVIPNKQTAPIPNVPSSVVVTVTTLAYAGQTALTNARHNVAVAAAVLAYTAQALTVNASTIVRIAFVGLACTSNFVAVVIDTAGTVCRWPFRFAYHLGVHRHRR